jgi:hypothetical protein
VRAQTGGNEKQEYAMTMPATTRAAVLASAMFACTAFAGSAFASSDINKCIAPSGTITLTDDTCPSGEQTVKLVQGSADAGEHPAAQGSVVPERFTVGRLPPRYVTLAKNPKPQRGLALDVATLRAAKLNMHLLDNAAQVLRSRRP